MEKERAVTVWSYMAHDQDTNNGKPYKRTICFRVGSINYDGTWFGPSDSFWIVPGTIEE
jgi:hypothetical protein